MKISGAWPASTAPRAKLNGKPARVGSSGPEVPTYRMLAIRASVDVRAAGRRGWSSVAAALCLVLGICAFEAGVPSVHHLAAGHSAITHCAIASATAHAPADLPEGVTVVPAPEPGRLASAGAPRRPVSISLRPDSGRAPPALA